MLSIFHDAAGGATGALSPVVKQLDLCVRVCVCVRVCTRVCARARVQSAILCSGLVFNLPPFALTSPVAKYTSAPRKRPSKLKLKLATCLSVHTRQDAY